MERAAWTDERLDDLVAAMRDGFTRVDQDIRDLRVEMHEGFAGVRREIRDGHTGLRAELNGLRALMFWFGGGMIFALVGIIAAILARGA